MSKEEKFPSNREKPGEDEIPGGGICGCGGIGCGTLFLLAAIGFPVAHMLGGTWEGGEMNLIPVGIGLPCFVFGNGFAIYSLFSPSRRERRLGKLALAAMWGIPAVLLVVTGVASWLGKG